MQELAGEAIAPAFSINYGDSLTLPLGKTQNLDPERTRINGRLCW
jgi:hypothetical protein